MIRRGIAVLLALQLVSSCAFTRKHPRVTLVSATTVIFSAGIGVPLSLDCDNATSTCSGQHVAAVFGIGAAIGLGIGLVAVHELGIGKPPEQPRPPPPADVSLMTCNEARREALATLENRCGEGGTVELPAVHRECVCRRPKGASGFECTLETMGICHPKVGEDMTLHGTCVCSAAKGCACSMRDPIVADPKKERGATVRVIPWGNASTSQDWMSSGHGPTPMNACGNAKLVLLAELEDICSENGFPGIESHDLETRDCSCMAGPRGASCATRAALTCAKKDVSLVGTGVAVSDSRTVAEAQADELARARCGLAGHDAAPSTTTCQCDYDGGDCACVAKTACQ